jgi:hypothetical protein
MHVYVKTFRGSGMLRNSRILLCRVLGFPLVRSTGDMGNPDLYPELRPCIR